MVEPERESVHLVDAALVEVAVMAMKLLRVRAEESGEEEGEVVRVSDVMVLAG